jgi:hypothetical protein
VRLPNPDRTVVADAKVRDYLLSPSHPVGRFKASFFVSLGFTVTNWKDLRDALLTVARAGEANPGQTSPYGLKYEVRGTITGPLGRQASVVTVWMVPEGRDFAHFVTAFPG